MGVSSDDSNALGAIIMNTQSPLKPGKVTISGAPDGLDARLIVETVQRADGPVLHVVRDDARMGSVKTSLEFVDPKLPVLVFPAWDCLPYDRISPNAEISAARMALLALLANGIEFPCVILTTLNAATQNVPARAVVKSASFIAEVGRQIDVDDLRSFLVRVGYSNAPTVTEPGDFAVRGGIIDIFPPGTELPVRLDLFGDVLDGARRFDPITQRTIEKITRVELAPASEVILDDASIERFRSGYRNTFGAAGSDDQLYAAVSEGRKHQGMEHWVALFHQKMETIFEYLPDAPVILDDQIDGIRATRRETIDDLYDARQAALKDKSGLSSVYKPLPPDLLYMDDAGWDAALTGRSIRQFSVLPLPTGPNALDAGGRLGRDFALERQQESVSLFGALADHIKAERRTSQVIVCSYSNGSRERFATMLEDAGITGASEVSHLSDVPDGDGGLYLAVWPLDQGFVGRGQTVITEQDILGDRLVRSAKKRKRAENYLTEATTLTPGDLVVHVEHGVGRYNGLETITAAGAPHECIALEYADNARLYLPVENIELLSRYGHDEGLLDRLGGGAWQAKKAKLKERIREMADKLIRIAAERELRKAQVMEPPEGMWESFCARFPYSETEDQ